VKSKMILRGLLTLALIFFNLPVFAKLVTISAPPLYFYKYALEWSIFIDQIKDPNNDPIIIRWQGGGGLVHMGDDVIDVLDSVKYKVIIFDLIGDAWSMHADTVCHGDNVIFNRHKIVFHPVDKGGVIQPTYDMIKENQIRMQGCIDQGLITMDDVYKSSVHYEVHVTKRDGKVIKRYIVDPRRRI